MTILPLYFITSILHLLFFFFFNDTATTEIYTLSLHDALPISITSPSRPGRARTISASASPRWPAESARASPSPSPGAIRWRSEEHTSELQSQSNLVCRLLLEKKKKQTQRAISLATTYDMSTLS